MAVFCGIMFVIRNWDDVSGGIMARSGQEEERPWVIGKVRVRLADGTEELWMTQMRPPSDGPYWKGWIAIPDDAEIVETVPMLRQLTRFEEVRIDQRVVEDSSPKQT
jgi:hypothetical protein